MPVYHFNVHDGVSTADPDGHELPNLDAAKHEAVVLAGALIQDLDADFWNGDEWRMDVTDETGLILFTLTFLSAMSAAARPSLDRLR